MSEAKPRTPATLPPGLIAFVCFLIASGLAVAAVYVLAGMGWALLAGAVPFLVAAGVIMRGLRG